jgi:hypothetical protein
VGVEAFQNLIRRAIFVVIAFNARDIHGADDVEAFLGIGVVSDNIAEASHMRAFLGFDVGENDLQSLQVAVYVSDYCVLHLIFRALSAMELTLV